MADALIERTVYEEILPKLPLETLHYYGFVEEPDREFAWVFIEDVSGQQYDRRMEHHRNAAGRWLGTMHTAATRLNAGSELPLRNTDYYLGILRSAWHAIRLASSRPPAGATDQRLLNTMLSHCEHLSARWHELSAACDATPLTLVHGDFIRKNVGVRPTNRGLTILPFDWANAGWGTPAEDIAMVDVHSYWLTVQPQWPFATIESFNRLAYAGKLFRCLVFLDWIVPRLSDERRHYPSKDLKQCESWLAALIQDSGWRP